MTKEAGGGKGRFGRAAQAPGRTVGQHPDGGDIVAREGRYGPYVAWNGVNATLPKGKSAAEVTLEDAIELVNARAAAAPSKGRRAAKKAPAKKAAPAKKSAK